MKGITALLIVLWPLVTQAQNPGLVFSEVIRIEVRYIISN
jgi:hypothetical protein